MREGLVRIDEVGRLVIPKEARKVLKISDSRLVQMYIERDKIVIKKYAPLLNEILLASKICKSIANTASAICIVCDTEKVLCVSSDLLSDLKLKKLSGEFLSAVENGMPLLINASEGSSMFRLVKDSDFEYYSLCAIALEREQKVGYLLLINTDKTQKFQVETLDILNISKSLIEGIL